MTAAPAEGAVPSRPIAAQAGAAQAGAAMLLGSAACFGLNIPFARLAAAQGVAGPGLVVFRVLVMLLVLGAVVIAGGVSLRVAARQRGQLLALALVSALLGLAYISSVSFIPVGIAVLIFYTFPLLIVAATPFVDEARLSIWQIAACLTSFAGIALAVGPSLGALDWRGLARAGLASCFAVAQFFLASRAPGGGGVSTIFWIHATILPVAIVIAAAFGGVAQVTNFENAAAPIIFTTLFYLVGVSLQFRGLGQSTAARAGLIYCLEPIVAVAFAAWLIGERLTLAQYAGGALVLLAVGVSMISSGAPTRADT